MKAPQRSIILPALLWASVALAAETPSDLESRAAEQERQIRQLEVQNQRLRDQIERLREQLAAQDDAPPAPPSDAAPAPAQPETESDLPPIDEEKSPIHIVRAGESLSRIAKQHGTTTQELAKLNDISNPSLIREGQRLKLPATNDEVPEPSTQEETVSGTHTVKEGETFFSIAKIYGLSVEALQAANPKVNPTALRIGQELKLTGKKPSSPEPAESEEPGAKVSSDSRALASNRQVIRMIPITEQISFGDFAERHQMAPAKLNALNGLQLEPRTVLDTGSRLYVSAQPLE